MQTLITIAPIFILIALGWVAAHRGFLPDEVLNPLNRLIYYFAIPAFLFHAISNFPLAQGFNIQVTLTTLGAAFLMYVSGWLFSKVACIPGDRAGVLIQGACHGNLGYIGLPVAFYFLGSTGLAQAGIISGFLMILQNVMSVSILQSFSSRTSTEKQSGPLVKLLQNPVIVSSMAGIIASGLELPIPEVIDRTLKMLGQLAPPAALLLIGASLSFKTLRSRKIEIAGAVSVKLILLPAFGLLLFTLLGVAPESYLPAFILLCTPTATVAYVMARQMHGDLDIAVTIISVSTLLSAITLPLWLALLHI
ncbi:MAG: AEC family transporter [Desulfuromonas sp.]|nr:MAG: AEC family transporter [Desulfuromonas sp.]